MRSIATEAGVDVALLSYFFGSKQGLFAAALRLQTSPAVAIAEALPGDIAGLAERLLRKLLTVWDDRANSAPMRAMLGVAVFSRYVLEAEPMAGATVDDVVGYLAPAIASVLETPARSSRRPSR